MPKRDAKQSGWREVSQRRYVRQDGAVVMWDDRSPHPNPVYSSARMWTAWKQPPHDYLHMSRGRLRKCADGSFARPGFPRRWNTAEAAMKAVDREYPLPSAGAIPLYNLIDATD